MCSDPVRKKKVCLVILFPDLWNSLLPQVWCLLIFWKAFWSWNQTQCTVVNDCYKVQIIVCIKHLFVFTISRIPDYRLYLCSYVHWPQMLFECGNDCEVYLLAEFLFCVEICLFKSNRKVDGKCFLGWSSFGSGPFMSWM